MRGEPDDAIEHFARAMRLSPLDPEMYRMQAGTALAHLFAGRFDEASSWAEKAFRDLPSFPDRGQHHRGKPCACRPNGRSAARDAPFAPARSRAAHLQSQGLAPDSTDPKISPRWQTACEEQGCRNSQLRVGPPRCGRLFGITSDAGCMLASADDGAVDHLVSASICRPRIRAKDAMPDARHAGAQITPNLLSSMSNCP